ncbi:hypothetical protein LXL04_016361 [Taraxacum kok-saghyz]
MVELYLLYFRYGYQVPKLRKNLKLQQDWENAKALSLCFMKSFHASKTMSDTLYVTANLHYHEILGVLTYLLQWKQDKDPNIVLMSDKCTTYKVLTSVVKDILVIPISTIASESTFSTLTCVVDEFRSSLGVKTVETLICTQYWLREISYVLILNNYSMMCKIYEKGLSRTEPRTQETDQNQWNRNRKTETEGKPLDLNHRRCLLLPLVGLSLVLASPSTLDGETFTPSVLNESRRPHGAITAEESGSPPGPPHSNTTAAVIVNRLRLKLELHSLLRVCLSMLTVDREDLCELYVIAGISYDPNKERHISHFSSRRGSWDDATTMALDIRHNRGAWTALGGSCCPCCPLAAIGVEGITVVLWELHISSEGVATWCLAKK